MNRISTKSIVLNGLMIAMVFLGTYITKIPGPVSPGYVNLGDAVIMVAAILMGRNTGLMAGAVGSALTDIVSGGMIFAPITFIVKGIEGYVIGLIASKADDSKRGEAIKLTAATIGGLIMVAGYFIAEATVLKLVDSTFGYSAAITELPANLVQAVASIAVGYTLSVVLSRSGARNALRTK